MFTARPEYIAGLRALADALETHPDLPLPYYGTRVPLPIYIESETPAAALRQFARATTGPVEKVVTDHRLFGFELVGSFHGLRVTAVAYREAVCERIVTGTREVERTMPDPDALAAVPTVTVTDVIEDVRWECRPLLAEAAA